MFYNTNRKYIKKFMAGKWGKIPWSKEPLVRKNPGTWSQKHKQRNGI
jgi:hypothetical protein